MARRKAAPAPGIPVFSPHEDAVIVAALAILEARLKVAGCTLAAPDTVSDFLQLQIGALDREVFGVLFLNGQHRLIAFEIMFQGTLTQTSVCSREVVRRALAHNAASVIFAHNHPCGDTEPSTADMLLTYSLKEILRLVDVRVLDHVVVGGGAACSFVESGRIQRGKVIFTAPAVA